MLWIENFQKTQKNEQFLVQIQQKLLNYSPFRFFVNGTKYSKINRKVNNIHTHFEFFYYQNHILLSIVATWINEITEIPLENPYRTLT